MANIDSPTYTKEAPLASPIGGGHGLVNVLRVKRFVVAIPAVFAINDVIRFGYMPKGARLVDQKLECSDIDTGGPTVTIDVGDAAVPSRLYAASVVGQSTSAPDRAMIATARDYKYAADTLITGLIKADATTDAAGTMILTLFYVQEDFATS